MDFKSVIITISEKFLIAIFLLAMIACEENNADFIESETAVVSVSVPESVTVNENFNVDLVVYGTSGCSEFSRLTSTEIGDTTVFNVFQKREGDLICTTNIIEIPVTISLRYESAGKKYLKFNTEGSAFSDFDEFIIDSLIVSQ